MPFHTCQDALQSVPQIFGKRIDANAFLLPGVTVTNGDGVVFERLMVDGDAERSADLVLSGVEFADASGVVVNGAHRGLKVAPARAPRLDDEASAEAVVFTRSFS